MGRNLAGVTTSTKAKEPDGEGPRTNPMLQTLLAKVVGTQNDRELKKLRPLVAQINALEPSIQPLSDDALRDRLAQQLLDHADGVFDRWLLGKDVVRGGYRPVPKTFESLIPDSLKKLMEFPGFAADNISRPRKEYLARGAAPSRTRYGWVRRA